MQGAGLHLYVTLHLAQEKKIDYPAFGSSKNNA
jgi:hypothetical protein